MTGPPPNYFPTTFTNVPINNGAPLSSSQPPPRQQQPPSTAAASVSAGYQPPYYPTSAIPTTFSIYNNSNTNGNISRNPASSVATSRIATSAPPPATTAAAARAAMPASAVPTQQQRQPVITTGHVTIVGGKAVTTNNTVSKNTTVKNETGTNGSTSSTPNNPPPHPEGRYANETLSILSSARSTSVARSLDKTPTSKKKRDACISVLERLVPSLFSPIVDGVFDNNENAGVLLEGKKRKVVHDGSSGEIKDASDLSCLDGKSRSNIAASSYSSDKVQSDSQSNTEAAAVVYEEEQDESSTHRPQISHSTLLKQEYKQLQIQNQLLLQRRNNVFKSMVQLHELYESGLDGIARMNDLRNVPDNVMSDKLRL